LPKGHVFDRPLLPDELIHPRLSNLARAIGAGIGSMIVAERAAPFSFTVKRTGIPFFAGPRLKISSRSRAAC
jgi:hypothetical protein